MGVDGSLGSRASGKASHGTVQEAGGPSADGMVGVVAGTAGCGGIFLELLAKGTVIEKSERGRRI